MLYCGSNQSWVEGSIKYLHERRSPWGGSPSLSPSRRCWSNATRVKSVCVANSAHKRTAAYEHGRVDVTVPSRTMCLTRPEEGGVCMNERTGGLPVWLGTARPPGERCSGVMGDRQQRASKRAHNNERKRTME